MDAAEIEGTAQHLASLGCTAEQIERHVNHLKRIAGRAPKQPKYISRKQLRPPTYRLTQDQIGILLPKLKRRSWRWTMWPGNDAKGDWVGHAILSVPEVPHCKSSVGFLVGDVLAQLRKLGLIRRVAISAHREAPTGPSRVPGGYRVEVVSQPQRMPRERLHEPKRMPRVRLNSAQKRERLGVSGLAGSGHTDIAGVQEAAQRLSLSAYLFVGADAARDKEDGEEVDVAHL